MSIQLDGNDQKWTAFTEGSSIGAAFVIKTFVVRHACTKNEYLPRQARDKHREKLKRETILQGTRRSILCPWWG